MFSERINRVLKQMEAKSLNQLIVTDPKSIWYLTGIDYEPFERFFAFLLKNDGNHVLFLNNLFCIENDCYKKVWYSDTDNVIQLIKNEIDTKDAIGIDKQMAARFLIPLMESCPLLTPVLASSCVDEVRACKDEHEIKLMKEASRINDEVITKASEFVKIGMTEKEVADFIDQEYLNLGAQGNSFETIVSFGANAADPHHVPDNTVLKVGECVLIDMGCIKDRYCSDMTRTFFSKVADPEYVKVHELVRQANMAAEKLIKPGVILSDVDKAARDLIDAEGYGEAFNHRLGHFIGQDDHEFGDVSSTSKIVAKEGMIFSIEPGIYLKNKFGVRIEDLVLVTSDGCEVLNKVEKHWKTVG